MHHTLTAYEFLWIMMVVAFLHFLGDFVFQSHKMASNKSKSNIALAQHVGVYTGTFAVGAVVTSLIIGGPIVIMISKLIAIAINGVLHFCQDWATSRWSAKYFGKNWHNFFVVIGLDQMLHMTFLAVLAYLAYTGSMHL